LLARDVSLSVVDIMTTRRFEQEVLDLIDEAKAR
jgi:hypothetical protein